MLVIVPCRPAGYRRQMSAEDPAHFANALAALDGTRFELGAAAAKVMMFMLEDPRGCDAVLAPSRPLEIQFGWLPGSHRYLAATAAPIVAALIELAGATAPLRQLRAVIGPHTCDVPGFVRWTFARTRLWLDATDRELAIRARGAEATDADMARLPAPIGYPYTVIEPAEPLACPHCAVRSPAYRRLSDGGLVCLRCGSSFNPPA
jgi:hypothetical protein